MFFDKQNRIWYKGYKTEKNDEPVIAYFRKVVVISEAVKSANIKISADSRYKLYVNGIYIQGGPEKGDLESWHYDEAQILDYLNSGENVISVEVLRFVSEANKRNHSIFIGPNPFLMVEGQIESEHSTIDLSTFCDWKVAKAEGRTLALEPFMPAPIHGLEVVEEHGRFTGWKMPGYVEDGIFEEPEFLIEADFIPAPGQRYLEQRTIPYQYHQKKQFLNVVCLRENESGIEDSVIKEQFKNLILGRKAMIISAHSSVSVELDAGELMTAFLILKTSQGQGADITIHCAESYGKKLELDPMGPPSPQVKTDRCDYVNGTLNGVEHHIHLAGNGTEIIPEEFIPFWFSTFRFVGIHIETKDEPLVINEFAFEETGYPLEVKTKATASDADFEAIWNICERTLRRCMHETYMDCPFYEQLSYAMDSRAQILYTYSIAADDRLARRCMEDIRRTRRADGMVNCCAPTIDVNVIPGFSIYYIMMIHDHMMYFGDRELICDHLPVIQGILRYFEKKITSHGYVGKLGGPLYSEYYWSFVDWTPEWGPTLGVPKATLEGTKSLTIESLLYSVGLQKTAELCEYVELSELAHKYREQAKSVNEAVKKYCTGKNGLLQDGPGVDDYSVHTQVYAVLANAVNIQEGKRLLNETVGNNKYAQCSVSMSFYLFRALEMVGLYDKTEHLWDLWRKMLANNLTTCVENGTDERSDCHAWGALLLYELPATILGVRPAKPGYEKVSIRPNPGYLSCAEGDCITPKGIVHVEWKKEANGTLSIKKTLPKGLEEV